ncbi:ABC transporter ATP-binding protein, partial [Mycobacteriaceae bacterium Msp059]|nr:ABC transporter ATP-binding protein [Mycobacteriaceae bacterium Msp059]
GMPDRQAVGRRQARVREIVHTLPPAAQEAIRDDLDAGSARHRAYENSSSLADAVTQR